MKSPQDSLPACRSCEFDNAFYQISPLPLQKYIKGANKVRSGARSQHTSCTISHPKCSRARVWEDTQSTSEIPSSAQEVSQELQGDLPNNTSNDAPLTDSISKSGSSNDSRKVSREDIELVQSLIERCLQFYMNRDEVVQTLLNRVRIEPQFTSLVWKKLEEENTEFFRAYYIRLKLKKQIILFNHLLAHQYHLMTYQVPVPPKISLAPIQNGIHPMPANNLPMGYPVLQPPPMSVAGQPHLHAMNSGLSRCQVVNGVSATGNLHPIQVNSGSDAMPSMSEVAISPASVASSGHFPFTTSEISGTSVDTSALATAFTLDVANSVGLQLGADSGRDSLRSLANIPWNFSLSDLTADLINLGDLGDLGNYPGSAFLPSDSDLLLDSPEQDDIVKDFFADSVPGECSQSDEDKL
ncbi:hypothetical protein C5167_015392 [Papaver somniferum]|uniref:Angiotensin-converting enzyme 2 n=1 Tax=Papaver somniferum TaxID=3469 RepID=A0A4Y7J5W2_PAPSO|nr:hypothetical protein C5167_015392 [Papaver somniferum]